jgi:hypothetical protein
MSLPEKTFLERVLGLIPGVAGYRDREARRETDRRLREYLAARIDEARDRLNPLRASQAGSFALLDEVGRLERILQKCAASLRYADQGYSGFFDQVRIGERELDRLYAHDEGMLQEVRGLAEQVRALGESRAEPVHVQEACARAQRLDTTIERRRELFHAPVE